MHAFFCRHAMQKIKNIILKAFDNMLIKIERHMHSLECFNNSNYEIYFTAFKSYFKDLQACLPIIVSIFYLIFYLKRYYEFNK